MKRHVSAILVALLVGASILGVVRAAQPLANIGAFTNKADGQIVYAADWNSAIGGIYSYINSTLLSVSTGLNCLTTKGDTYVFDGANLNVLHAGSNGQVIQADSTQATGLKFGSVATVTNLTTKGDLLGYASALARIPVGTDGQSLVADSTNANGVSWQTPSNVPTGTIVSWSPTVAGTNTIPTGWCLCDGQSHTSGGTTITPPNLIGRFILGTRPVGSGATPSTGGYGAISEGNTGATGHTHQIYNNGYGYSSYTGYIGVASTNTTAANDSTSPVVAAYALVYICHF